MGEVKQRRQAMNAMIYAAIFRNGFQWKNSLIRPNFELSHLDEFSHFGYLNLTLYDWLFLSEAFRLKFS